MNSLNAFLHPLPIENKKVVVSKRFVEDGKPVEWEIRAIGEKENAALEKKYTTQEKRTGSQVFHRNAYVHQLVADAVVFPDLTNAELQKNFQVLGASELLQTMLSSGEFAYLSEEVSELSGLDRNDINEQIDEAKNS